MTYIETIKISCLKESITEHLRRQQGWYTARLDRIIVILNTLWHKRFERRDWFIDLARFDDKTSMKADIWTNIGNIRRQMRDLKVVT